MTKTKQYQVLFDSHVHFYSSWGISFDDFLSITFNNLTKVYNSSEEGTQLPVICLLNTYSKNGIDTVISKHKSSGHVNWVLSESKNNNVLWATDQNKTMLLVLGAQLITTEGLEILQIGNPIIPEKKCSIHEILKTSSNDVLTIIPWAVGKWLGGRGKTVLECLEKYPIEKFYLGDNGGRPWFWQGIKPFKQSIATRRPILRGSDPLPIAKGYVTSGSFGNNLSITMDIDNPWSSLRESLSSANCHPFGKLCGPFDFFNAQLMLRSGR